MALSKELHGRRLSGKEIWHRIKDEPDDAFAGFNCYLFQFKPRRKSDITVDGSFVKEDVVHRWSIQHHWKERMQAFDDHLHESHCEERERVLDATMRDLTLSHAKTLTTGFELAVREIQKYLAQSRSTESPVLQPSVAFRFFQNVISMQRLNNNLSTENVAFLGDMNLSPEELEQLEKIQIKLAEKKDGK